MHSKKEDLGSVVGPVFDEKSDFENPRLKLVWEEAKGRDGKLVYWKLPGGMVEVTDVDPVRQYDDRHTTENAFRREVFEEAGVEIDIVVFLSTEKKVGRGPAPHLKHYFFGVGDFSEATKSRGDEGEIIGTFSLEEVRRLPNFFPPHLPILDRAVEKMREILTTSA